MLTKTNTGSGRIIVLSGPSGVGKSTVVNGLMQAGLMRRFNIYFSISFTTRPPRPQEKEEQKYFFITRSNFLTRIKKGEMIEYAEFLGNYYGTSKHQLETALSAGQNVLLEIEIKGAMQIISYFKNRVLSIFLLPPSMKELNSRICHRAVDSQNMIKLRLKRAATDLQHQSLYQHRVVNRGIAQTVREIHDIFDQELIK